MIATGPKQDRVSIREMGETLMNHQCWFFGRDIWHPDGNLLIRYGFERFPCPAGQNGGNSYRTTLDECAELVVWGFGIFLGTADNGGIFISRFDFTPKLLKRSRLDLPIWKPDQISPRRRPRTNEERSMALSMTVRVIDWVIEYEAWIEELCGKGWRGQCLAEWDKATLRPEQVMSGRRRLRDCLKERSAVLRRTADRTPPE